MNVDALSGLYFINTNVFVYSFDSLAAIDLGCNTLLSEDLQSGRKIRDLRIVNPFSTS